jgi:hypothetical protein
MNDDEFLNDRDCTPKGETPRTDAAMFYLYDGTNEAVTKADFARELERELCRYEIAYARAMKVLGMAKVAMEWGDQMPGALKLAIKEWDDGR